MIHVPLLKKGKETTMIWIIGAGVIACEYAKILNALDKEFICIGRGEQSAKCFEETIGAPVIIGGLNNYLGTKPTMPEAVIIATNAEQLAGSTIDLVNYGVKRILCEKPGFNNPSELDAVYAAVIEKGAEVYYAYNRRFFAATLAAEKVIEEDGGLLSFNFEFTEWGHVIEKSLRSQEVKKNWFYANSTHVIDLAFFLGGTPVDMKCFAKDKSAFNNPINFAGAGKTDKNVLFSYNANWNAPGRWAVELLTLKHRIYLKPMEQLQLQDKGSVKVYPVEIDDYLDKEFKPGFYLETKAFLEDDNSRLCSLDLQKNNVKNVYNKILLK